jgi:hypothetical protein
VRYKDRRSPAGFEVRAHDASEAALGPVVTNNLKDFGKIQAVESRLFLVHPDFP